MLLSPKIVMVQTILFSLVILKIAHGKTVLHAQHHSSRIDMIDESTGNRTSQYVKHFFDDDSGKHSIITTTLQEICVPKNEGENSDVIVEHYENKDGVSYNVQHNKAAFDTQNQGLQPPQRQTQTQPGMLSGINGPSDQGHIHFHNVPQTGSPDQSHMHMDDYLAQQSPMEPYNGQSHLSSQDDMPIYRGRDQTRRGQTRRDRGRRRRYSMSGPSGSPYDMSRPSYDMSGPSYDMSGQPHEYPVTNLKPYKHLRQREPHLHPHPQPHQQYQAGEYGYSSGNMDHMGHMRDMDDMGDMGYMGDMQHKQNRRSSSKTAGTITSGVDATGKGVLILTHDGDVSSKKVMRQVKRALAENKSVMNNQKVFIPNALSDSETQDYRGYMDDPRLMRQQSYDSGLTNYAQDPRMAHFAQHGMEQEPYLMNQGYPMEHQQPYPSQKQRYGGGAMKHRNSF